MSSSENSVTHAKIMNIELKESSKADNDPRMGFDVWLEVGTGQFSLGTLVTVRTWVGFDPAHTPLSEIHAAAAGRVHQALQVAAASSPERLAELMRQSLLHKV